MLVTIGQYREAPEAYLVRGALAAEGIEAVISDEQVVGINWLYSNAIGGVKLAVDSDSVQQAADVLRSHGIDRESREGSALKAGPHHTIGILAVFILSAAVVPMLVVAVPLLALNRRRGLG